MGVAFSTLLHLDPAPPRSSSGRLSLLWGVVNGVRHSVHALHSGEDVGVIREDVVGGESNELTTTPEQATEEVECVDGVGEAGKDIN
ncbi:hypothetical protein D1007_37661 [Hordeum vulgare]|nr:hypothetical protein D1007_37661 [Hordeum vulgare]